MNQEPNKQQNQQQNPQKMRKPNFLIYLVVLAAIIGIWIFSSDLLTKKPTEFTSSEFSAYFYNESIQIEIIFRK